MRIVALDLIRFFAALSVVLYHYISLHAPNAYPLISEAAKYGYLGVPLFFIISGYVIALSANNRTALQFGISRFVRLYPALWAGVIFTVLVLVVLTDKQYSVQQVLANFTLLNDHFGFKDIDSVYWTLKVELKFYAGVFLLLIFGVFKRYHIWLSLWLGLTVLQTLFGQSFYMGWVVSTSYSSFFIAGVAFSLVQNTREKIFVYFVLILSLMVSSIRTYEHANSFIVDPTIVEKLTSVTIVWVFYCVMYFLSIGKINLRQRNVYITLGALTYPLYLIHNMAGRAIIDQYSNIIPEKIMIIIVIILMVLVSWILHLVIEKPLATPMKNYLLSIFSHSKPLTK
jgi:peptidoglycan/LPS O-acetylase OafA/YrhL